MSRALFSLLLVAPLAAGCVTLLPKNRPAQLYRFEAAAPQSPTGPAPITLTIDRVVLPAAATCPGRLAVLPLLVVPTMTALPAALVSTPRLLLLLLLRLQLLHVDA